MALDYLESNRASWDERVPIHAESSFYNVAGWLAGEDALNSELLDLIAPREGESVIHLQCHIGLEALTLARHGAVVVGVDFSVPAIEFAREAAARAHLSHVADFQVAQVTEAGALLSPRRFDVALTTVGSLCWLPRIADWASMVASLLDHDGRLILHDVHPLARSLAKEGQGFRYSYFEEVQPYTSDELTSYAAGHVQLDNRRVYKWNHGLGEIVTALASVGLVTHRLVEHDWTSWQQFPWLTPIDSYRFGLPPGHARIPLSFTLLAHRWSASAESIAPSI